MIRQGALFSPPTPIYFLIIFQYIFFTAHLITDEILLQLDESDLTKMDIMEIGPRKIILGFISKKTAELEHDAHGEHQHLLHEKVMNLIILYIATD